MLYVEQSLTPGEELIHVGHFHWMYTVAAFFAIVWGFFLGVLIVVGGVYGYSYMGYLSHPVTLVEAIRTLHPGIRGVAFLMFILGLVKFAHMMIIRATTEIAITNNRVVYKRGVIARQAGEISIDRIEGVNVMQTILGRIFDYGQVVIHGMGVGQVTLPSIQDPVSFRRAIEKARSL